MVILVRPSLSSHGFQRRSVLGGASARLRRGQSLRPPVVSGERSERMMR